MSVPPSTEHRIVCWVMENGTVAPLRDRGVDPTWFHGREHRAAIDFILGHVERYGSVPSDVTFRNEMGSYLLFSVPEAIQSLLDDLSRILQWNLFSRSLPDLEDLLRDGDTDAFRRKLMELAEQSGGYIPAVAPLIDSMDQDRLSERWEHYERRESGKVLIGMSTGFPTIDRTTLGLQPGQLITVLALPKVGKTTLCMAIANNVYLTYEVPILFVSYEMGAMELEMRQESMLAALDFKALQQGTLTKIHRKRYQDYLDAAVGFEHPYYIMDAAHGYTVSAIRSQIERVDPALVVLDGIYMMTDEMSGEANTALALTNITRSLKRMAMQVGKPVIINTQALAWKSKGNRISMDSAGYSSSFAQDSDVVLGIERITPPKGEDELAYANSRMLRVLASRNSGLAAVELDFDYSAGRIEEFESEEEE